LPARWIAIAKIYPERRFSYGLHLVGFVRLSDSSEPS
jgi:hypothetical protein